MVEEFDALQWHCKHSNPDFAADPARLLREMMKRDDSYDFINTVGKAVPVLTSVECFIDTNYIAEPGLMLKAVAEWLKKEERCI
jgi:hypothetical protein